MIKWKIPINILILSHRHCSAFFLGAVSPLSAYRVQTTPPRLVYYFRAEFRESHILIFSRYLPNQTKLTNVR